MSQRFISVYSIFGKVRYAGMLVSGFSILIMMFYVSIDVVLRNFTTSGTLYTYEITSHYFMPLIVFPGLAYTFSEGIMPRINFIIEKLNNIKVQKVTAISLIVIEIILTTLLAFYGYEYAMQAIESNLGFTAGGSNYRTWPVILLGAIGFLLVIIEMIFLLIKNILSKEPSFTVIKKDQEI